jgi:hypothetical protein
MRVACSFALGLTLAHAVPSTAGQERLAPDAPRPIAAGESLWAEELTFMDVREAVRSGTTTIIIGTGGVEQNGPYVAGGKHNRHHQRRGRDVRGAAHRHLPELPGARVHRHHPAW